MIERELPWLAGVDAAGASVTADRISVGGWLVSPAGPDGSTVRIGGRVATVHWERGTDAVPGVPADWPVWTWRAEAECDQPVGAETTVTAPDGTELSHTTVWPESSYREPAPLGEIDFPAADAEIAGDLMVVSGWLLLDGKLPSHVEVDVEGAAPQRARLMLPRPDVTSALPGQIRQAGLSGYEARIALPQAPGESRKVAYRVRAWTRDGREWTSPTRYATLRRRPVSRRDAEAVERSTAFTEELLGRVKAAVDTDHVLVVTHSLRVGGGQFWLSELLRHLAGPHEHKITLVSPEDGPLRTELEELGVTVHVTGHHRVQDAVTYTAYVGELAMLATASGAGVVLVNTLGMFAGVDAAMRAGLPVAWVIHESFSLEDFAYLNWGMDALDPLVRARWEHCLSDADALLFVADATREMFLPWSRPRRCITVRYGIDLAPAKQALYTTKEEVRRELGLPERATVLVNIGVSEPRKGHAPLLLAFEQVRTTHPDAHLVIVGTHESPYCDALTDYVEAAGLGGSVSLVPIVRDPLPWLRAADLFVNSSDIESLPRSILEAMAFRVPVVAADVFGTREIVSDGESGWLFLPNDLNALTVGLLRALDTPPAARERIAERALAGVGSFLDSAHYGQEFSTILNGLARGTGTEERHA
ncbi:glycosyltransferase family 4 protein [Amycolatopsis sp. CA-126428]|uniref:glycosyltransferase family 4 protein n=1 Tax=Amycolatopsis sp. CA-126428 TaxID=2073158 RepID=UPI000CD1F7BF|nr:glycosyltransferase family 4 protein [Amycolatopsis sp. CA-126428]